MANYKKSFSFRNGVQVDNDNFVVNTNGLIGIGTNIPTNNLDLRGNASISGIASASGYFSSGISTFQNNVLIGTGITFDPSTNTIFAPNIKIGTSPSISNVVGYSTVGWIVNPTAYGISTSLNVGIHTDAPTEYQLTVGGNPSIVGETGIGVTGGNIKATGIITASSFSGTVDVNDLSGVIGDDHLPNLVTSNINITTGISTFNNVNIGSALTVTGTLTGTASTAQTLTGTPDITVGVTTVSRLKATYIGIGTESPEQAIQVGAAVTTNNNVSVIKAGNIGIGTTNPSEAIEVYNNANAAVKLTSGSNSNSKLTLGSSTVEQADIKYDSSTDILSLKNYSGKDIQFDVTTTNSGDGGIVLKRDNSRVFTITNEGKVAINKNIDPADGHSLEVIGSAKIGGGSSVTGSLTINSDGSPFTLTGGTQTFPINPDQNLHSTSGITTLRELHIIQEVGFNGINLSGAGVGKTVAIGTITTLFGDNSLIIGTGCTIRGNLVLDQDLTINKDVRIGTGATYTDEVDGTELKLIVNQTAEFNRAVSFGSSTITGITSIPTSVGVGTTANNNPNWVGIGTTASISFDVPSWATTTRVSFTNLSTGIGQRGFRLRVNDQTNNYDGFTMLHFPYSPSQFYGQSYSSPVFSSTREDWTSTDILGCFVGVSSGLLGGNEFGRYISATGYVEFKHLDPSSTTPYLMVSGVVNLNSITGIETHSSQAILSGQIRLGAIGSATTFSSVSIAATGITGEENNYLHVGIGSTVSNMAIPAFVNVSHTR
jgi:hypothetical protein